MRSTLAQLALAAGLMAVVGWPALATARQAWYDARPTASEIARPLELAGATLQVVATAVAIALPLGTLLALVLVRTDLWGRGFLLGLMALAVFIPLPLQATAWLGAFGNLGRSQAIGSTPLLVGWRGAAVVHALAALPWVVMLVGVGARAVEPELEEAALLDWPAWRVAVGVTLRRSLGAIAGAALAVAVLTAGDMTVTDLVQPQARTFAEEAYNLSQRGLGQGAVAARVALPTLVVLGLLVALAARGLLRADPSRVATADAVARTWRLGRWRRPLGLLVVATVGTVLALPFYALIWRAGRVGGGPGRPPRWSWGGLLGTLGSAFEELWLPLLKSLTWAAVGATLAVALAWPLAWSARRPGPWRWAAIACVALALATPGPVAGIALALAYVRVPWVYDTPVILVLAYALRTLPFAVIVLWPALRRVPEAHLEAALLDGHGPWGQARWVALPLTRDALLASWAVAFVLSLGELPAALRVEPPSRVPLVTVLVWNLLHTGVESHLAGVALVLLLAVALAGGVAAWALRPLYGTGARDKIS